MKTTLLLFCALVFAAGNATPVEGGSVTLIWTATGDNANSGCADGYELRYSPEKPDSVKGISVWWAEAISVDGPPGVPACAGEPDTALSYPPYARIVGNIVTPPIDAKEV